ncbi:MULTISPECIES: hypothetical protein [unclassified Crossiella]|uniref:hypothetical protein n=1 Tax=unclassified Crossiella TaxID=2620835 RepID=UPI001FFFBBF4|nr:MULTISPECIES: hypothetical protein [unclassified Crossiella]MCK2241333.1 hypothetical protein [Crossiella sp. S99.2]MCK2253523.1 hypothetical protein [Crossiella sp. S99.1]
MRKTLRTIATAVAVAATMLVPATVSAAAQGNAPGSARNVIGPPVGVWTGKITFPSMQVDAKLSFHLNGTLCYLTKPEDGVEGKGRWRLTGLTSFDLNGIERFFDSSGATTGSLTFAMAANYQGLTGFAANGSATFYDAKGNKQDTVPISAHLNRQSVIPAPCPS